MGHTGPNLLTLSSSRFDPKRPCPSLSRLTSCFGAARFWEAIGFSRVEGQPWSHEAVVLTVESASGPIHEVAERFVEVRSVWQDRPDMLRLSSSQF